jgi:hypothetical protein
MQLQLSKQVGGPNFNDKPCEFDGHVFGDPRNALPFKTKRADSPWKGNQPRWRYHSDERPLRLEQQPQSELDLAGTVGGWKRGCSGCLI